MDLINKIINESSLSRVFNHIEQYDIAMITAFRGRLENCILQQKSIKEFVSTAETKTKPVQLTKSENLQRNKELKASLLKLNYGVTAIDGSYIENYGEPDSREVAENSFLVVNLKKDAGFFNNIIKLGKAFCQDSVFLKPVNADGFLYGTNNAEFPGLDNKQVIGQFKGGKSAEFFSKVKNRAFTFEHFNTYTRNSKWSITELAKPILDKLKSINDTTI